MRSLGCVLTTTLLCCSSSFDVDVDVEVIGGGRVDLGGSTCSGSCVIRTRVGQSAVAIPDDQSIFLGWSGFCSGVGPCTVNGAGALRALFRPKGTLLVETRGDGFVRLGNGSVCDRSCEFSLDAPTTLEAVPRQGSEFEGFAGACVGTGFCQISGGLVVAVFRLKKEAVQFTFEGTGSGEVTQDGASRCTSDCTLLVDPNRAYEFQARPSPGSAFRGFMGACSGQTCRVRAPAVVKVRFQRTRTLSVVFAGMGSGSIAVDGKTCTASCSVDIPEDGVRVAVGATSGSFVARLSGACTDVKSECLISPGLQDVELTVELGKVLQWSRSFALSQNAAELTAILVDENGILFATQSAAINVDGTSYGSATDYAATVVGLNWDAGVSTLIHLADNTPLSSFARISSIVRGEHGQLFGFGSCSGEQFVNVPCRRDGGPGNTLAYVYPAAFSAADGGLTHLRVDMDRANTFYGEATRVDGGIIVQANPTSINLHRLQKLDESLVQVSVAPTPFSFFYGPMLLRSDGRLLMTGLASAPFSWLGCSMTQGIQGSSDTLIFTLDSELTNCLPLGEIRATAPMSGSGVLALTQSAGRPTAFSAGVRGTVEFSPGRTVTGQAQAAGILGETGFRDVTATSVRFGDSLLRDLWWSSRGLQAAGETPWSTPFFGRSTVGYRGFVATFEPDAGVGRFYGISETNPGSFFQLRGAHFGGKTVLFVTGDGLRFEGEALAPDSLLRVHVVVLEEPPDP